MRSLLCCRCSPLRLALRRCASLRLVACADAADPLPLLPPAGGFNQRRAPGPKRRSSTAVLHVLLLLMTLLVVVLLLLLVRQPARPWVQPAPQPQPQPQLQSASPFLAPSVPLYPLPVQVALNSSAPCRLIDLSDPVAAGAFLERDGRRDRSLRRPLINSAFDVNYVANFASWLRLLRLSGWVAVEDLALLALDGATADYLTSVGLGEVCVQHRASSEAASAGNAWLNAGLSKMRMIHAIVRAGFSSLHIEQDVMMFPRRATQLLVHDTYTADVACLFYVQTDQDNQCNLGFLFTSAHPDVLRMLQHVVDSQKADPRAWDQALVSNWMATNIGACPTLRYRRLYVDEHSRDHGSPLAPFGFEQVFVRFGDEVETVNSLARVIESPRHHRMVAHMVGNPAFTRRWLMHASGINNWIVSSLSNSTGPIPSDQFGVAVVSDSASATTSGSHRFVWLRRPLLAAAQGDSLLESRHLIQLLAAVGVASGRRVILPTFEVAPHDAPLNFACQPQWPPSSVSMPAQAQQEQSEPLGSASPSQGSNATDAPSVRAVPCLRPFWRFYRMASYLDASIPFEPASFLFSDNEDAKRLQLHRRNRRRSIRIVVGEAKSDEAEATPTPTAEGTAAIDPDAALAPAPAGNSSASVRSLSSFGDLMALVRQEDAARLLVLDVEAAATGQPGIGIEAWPRTSTSPPSANQARPHARHQQTDDQWQEQEDTEISYSIRLDDVLKSVSPELRTQVEAAAAPCRGRSRGSDFCQ